jgi:cellulose synthase/poly-beta-1,6-N-acetylglucosamine synthase-like glycosyltransferase
MLYNLLLCIVCILAAYGLLTLISGIAESVRCRVSGIRPEVRVVILVQNAEEQIEYIVRNAVKKDIQSKMLSDKKVVFVDMDSKDKTNELLEKLQKNFSSIEVLPYPDRAHIYDGFSIFSPSAK